MQVYSQKKCSLENLKTCFQPPEIQQTILQWITSYLWGLHFVANFGLGISVGHVERGPWLELILDWIKWAGQLQKPKHQFSKTNKHYKIHPKNWWFGSMFLLFRGWYFQVPCLFSGVYLSLSPKALQSNVQVTPTKTTTPIRLSNSKWICLQNRCPL